MYFGAYNESEPAAESEKEALVDTSDTETTASPEDSAFSETSESTPTPLAHTNTHTQQQQFSNATRSHASRVFCRAVFGGERHLCVGRD